MTRLPLHIIAAAFIALPACYRQRAFDLTCTPPPRRGTGFERRISLTADSAPHSLRIRVTSMDRSPGPLSNAVVRWASLGATQSAAVPSVRWDSATFSPGIVAPGTYVVHVSSIGYQTVDDTIVVRSTTQAIEYGMWEDPICLAERGSSSRPAAAAVAVRPRTMIDPRS